MSQQCLDNLVAQLQARNSAYSGHYEETVNTAIDELVHIVMENPGPGREPGIPTRGEANLLFWLERCKTKHCVDKPLPLPDHEFVAGVTDSGESIDNYPSKPYITPPFQATVHTTFARSVPSLLISHSRFAFSGNWDREHDGHGGHVGIHPDGCEPIVRCV